MLSKYEHFPTRPTRNCLNNLPIILPNVCFPVKKYFIAFYKQFLVFAGPVHRTLPSNVLFYNMLALKYGSHRGVIYFVSWLWANRHISFFFGGKKKDNTTIQAYKTCPDLYICSLLKSLYCRGGKKQRAPNEVHKLNQPQCLSYCAMQLA